MHSRLPWGVRPRLEGKPRTPLSSRVATRVSWSPLSGLKGVQPPLPFGERTRDCSTGHAGKEGPQLARMGASQAFPRAGAPVGVFSYPGDLPNPGIEPRSPALQTDSFPAEPQGKPQNTGVVSLSLLQGIFPTQGSNPGLPHCRRILYQLNHKGSPRILEWVAYPFSSRSSQPRDRTQVSCIAGRLFTS